jgi:oligopeptide transport system permease protein
MSTNQPPSAKHWFGTDELGRDVFARTWYGARISLFIGLAAALIDLFIGVLWGGIAGFRGGKTDEVMMRIADILWAVPYLLLVILLMVILGQGLGTMILAMTITGWINMARIVRGQVLQLKNQEYVLAAQTLGASTSRIMFKHLIPNAMGPILVTLTLTIPSAIFTEAFLSYLGLGVPQPLASWGTMASEGVQALQYYPWRLFFPATFICLTIFAFNVVGDGLRDALDPRLRK